LFFILIFKKDGLYSTVLLSHYFFFTYSQPKLRYLSYREKNFYISCW